MRAMPEAMAKLRDLMWRHVGILRDGKELRGAIETLKGMGIAPGGKDARADCELKNLHALGELIARSALAREESRGSHYRGDFPYRDDEGFQKHSVIVKGQEVGFEKI